ncbi:MULTISPECIES: hypothetical protein [Moorena]|nr:MULTISPECIES: hypothetical protein [Moorena]
MPTIALPPPYEKQERCLATTLRETGAVCLGVSFFLGMVSSP